LGEVRALARFASLRRALELSGGFAAAPAAEKKLIRSRRFVNRTPRAAGRPQVALDDEIRI
jgi:hypothetical protein